MHDEHDSLVPLAEEPRLRRELQESVKETLWENVTDKDIPLEVYVGWATTARPHPDLNTRDPELSRLSPRKLTREERTPTRLWIVKARSTRAIPEEFDMEIQRHQCTEPECTGNPLGCKDNTHRKMIVGGLVPQGLIKRGMQHRPVLSPVLDTLKKEAAAAEEKEIKALVMQKQAETALEEHKKEIAALKAALAKRDADTSSVEAPAARRDKK